jgi:hypothetical protein
MKQIELMLKPQPQAKPEFLATIQVVDPSPAVSRLWQALPESIVLEDYTREGWAWKPSNALQSLTIASTDGRHKLKGFCGYLKERQKSAYGRFASQGLWVVSYTAKFQAEEEKLECRVCLDMSQIQNCSLKPLQSTAKSTTPPVNKTTPSANKPATTAPPRKSGGLLGKLVGAQQRTNQHVAMAHSVRPANATATASNRTSAATTAMHDNGIDHDTSSSATAGGGTKTAQQVLADFRQSMADKMLDFDLAPDEVVRIHIALSDYHKGLSTMEEKGKVTMELLKYMVYEAAEEVNEEWIAHREPTGFMDEATFVIYKEGAAPPEVLEEINQGELPEEVRGQQRAIQEERSRQRQQAESKHKSALESQAHRQLDDEEEALAALNTNKRDRRTIEDYERERRESAKRGRN